MINSSERNILLARGARLKEIRKLMGLTIIKFGTLCNVGESTIRQWEAGRGKGLSEVGAYKIVAAIQNTNILCDVDWLLHGKGIEPKFKDNRMMNLTISKPDSTPSSSTYSIHNEINVFKQNVTHSIVYHLDDDSMEPIYLPNDFLGGERYSKQDIKHLIGEICIVKTINNQIMVRKIAGFAGGKKYHLSCLNHLTKASAPMLEASLDFAAPIIRVWRIAKNFH